ncbi:MAG TPA: hypothetical protein VK213_13740 [Bacteroidales bacterium]|nr:hypothetical protein [Bacteroidales bacterium]
MEGKKLSVSISTENNTLATWSGDNESKIVRIPFPVDLKPAEYIIKAEIRAGQENPGLYVAYTRLVILKYKPNEVKTDRLTGGLIVNRRPFFPFGFYTYSPVDQSLPEEEIVKGFNMISPYQKISPESLSERKAYMDRCAQLGMKVHYNLLSVSGGGGVGSRINGITEEEKMKRLLDEIATFKDHPALLGWYIADEPNGYKIPPAELEKIYNTVHENDPWHPVSIVFMAPFVNARDYENAMDIVMADPYPLPDLPVTLVGNVAGDLRKEFNAKRPVWMVPQAFGGGELWSREPTFQELRSMTWQSIANGATGIQYFVRQGPNYFPKSPSAWAECGRMAMEVAEITPWLLSDEETLPVTTGSKNVIVSSRMHNGKLIVIAVNKYNEPAHFSVKINGISDTKARSIFENRVVPVQNGSITDNIPPYGSIVYLINRGAGNNISTASINNLLTDPGFEDLSTPGIPSACYARPGGDKGATYFLDSREHYEGDHSLRLFTPAQNKSVTIRFFPVKLKPGASYIVSIWAKADPEQRFRLVDESDKKRPVLNYPQYVEISLGDFSHSWFVPGSEWRQFVTFVTIPADESPQVKSNLVLKMPGQGVAWFDQVKIMEEK